MAFDKSLCFSLWAHKSVGEKALKTHGTQTASTKQQTHTISDYLVNKMEHLETENQNGKIFASVAGRKTELKKTLGPET